MDYAVEHMDEQMSKKWKTVFNVPVYWYQHGLKVFFYLSNLIR